MSQFAARFAERPYPARTALALSWRAPRALVTRWCGPALLAVALVGSAALATGSLDVGRAEGFRFGLVAIGHQLVVLGLSVCRCVWFQGAVRVVRGQLAGGSAARR